MSTTDQPVFTPAPPTTVLVSLGKFDKSLHNGRPTLRIPRSGVPLDQFQTLAVADYSPDGSTPLRDAVASFISHLDGVCIANPDSVVVGLLADESGSMGGKEQAVVNGINEFVGGMADVDRVDGAAAGKVLCVIVTDGLENSSTETTAEQLKAMIAEREQRGWTFIYMGSNQDAWAAGQATGFSGGVRGQTVNYAPSAAGTAAAFRAVASDASCFIADNASYGRMRSSTSKRSVAEDGDEVAQNTFGGAAPGQPTPAPTPGEFTVDASDALRRARGE